MRKLKPTDSKERSNRKQMVKGTWEIEKWPQYWGDTFKTHTSNGDEKKQGRNGGNERGKLVTEGRRENTTLKIGQQKSQVFHAVI